MRAELAKRDGHRGVFTATYREEGSRTSRGYTVPMLLFVNVCDGHGNQVTDHLWFGAAQCWLRLNLEPGQRVQFCARVRPYWKGYHDNRRRDFKLSHPTDIRLLCAPSAHPPDPQQPELAL